MTARSPRPTEIPRRPCRARWCHGLAVILLASACQGRGASSLPHHYDDKGRMLAKFDDPKRDAWALPDRVMESLALERDDLVIADIGAGSGYFSRRLAEQVPNGLVYALDIDHDFKAFIRDHRETWGTPNIEPRLAMYDSPLLKQASVDLVFLSNTYAFIEDRQAYFTEVRGTLKPGGTLVVIEFRHDAQCTAIEVCPRRDQRVGRDLAVGELERAGFVLAREETFLPHQYFLILTAAEPS